MIPPSDILQRYPDLSWSRVQFLGNRGGFSGAQLWRLATPAGDFCLKAWPTDGITVERLTWIHDLLRVARQAGIAFVPQILATSAGPTLVVDGGRLWDCASWLPGAADFHDHPSPARVVAAGAALAQLHIVWQNVRPRTGPCPVVQRRLETLKSWRALVSTGWQPVITADDPVRPWAEHAWHLLPRAAPQAERALLAWRDVALPIQPCWCDPWHDHVLFAGDRVSGLIDYGAVKEDHVAIDLARMLGSMVGNDQAAWETALTAYQAIRPLTDQERRLAIDLEFVGLVNALVTWLGWLYHDGRVFEDRLAIAKRLETMVARLHNDLALQRPVGVV